MPAGRIILKKETIMKRILSIISALTVLLTSVMISATADNKNIKISFSGEYKKSNENKIENNAANAALYR